MFVCVYVLKWRNVCLCVCMCAVDYSHFVHGRAGPPLSLTSGRGLLLPTPQGHTHSRGSSKDIPWNSRSKGGAWHSYWVR